MENKVKFPLLWYRILRLIFSINHLNTELNNTCHLLALLGTHHILNVSRLRVKERQSFDPI
jgi:hypothetical protein